MFVGMKGKKIAIYTLGCKVNQYESDCMADILSKEGAVIVGFTEAADIYIINTCAVTNIAERKSRQIIHRAKKYNDNALIVACGCYVQEDRERLMADPMIDIIVGNNKKKNIAEIIDAYYNAHTEPDNVIDINFPCEYEEMQLVKPKEHMRAYVKVQDGCNNFCTYCIIPYTRGRIRSREIGDVVSEVKGLAENGIKEVVVTGINLSSYACGEIGLMELLMRVAEISGIERVRMGSLEPRIITDRFLSTIVENEKICPHFHLSLQSACNETLKRMNRRYTIEEYMAKCELIRKYYDRPAITTDIIVGFPGETDEEFHTTVENLEKLNLYEMHIFKYSKRKGTPAAAMENQVPDSDKESRSNRLLNMTARHKSCYEESFQGEQVKVLYEEYEERDGRYFIKGHTDRYILIEREYDEDFCKSHLNELVLVTA